jgi:hypothetical protein
MFCLQEKLRRAEALASERETLTNHLRRTLEQQDLRVKQVSSRSYAATSQCWPAELYHVAHQCCPVHILQGRNGRHQLATGC